MNTEAPVEPGRTWDSYWSEGHRHACPTSFSGFYGAATQAFWRTQCEGLGRHDLVLEFGCGNGGLLTFLQSVWPAGRGPELHGVDAAVIDPTFCRETATEPDRIHIHGRTLFSRIPLPDDSVALAVSQFGIEYGNEDATWSELQRVTRAGTRLAFILHKRGSRLDQVAADEVSLSESALLPQGVFATAGTLLPYLVDARTEAGRAALDRNPAAQKARSEYNASAQALLDVGQIMKHGDAVDDIMSAISAVLGQASVQPMAELEAALRVVRGKVEDNLQRIRALRACALDSQGLQAVCERLTGDGFRLDEPRTMSEQGYEMGWQLRGTRDRGT